MDYDTGMIKFLNKNTAPNMPMWAAVKACMTIPFFMEPMRIKKGWWQKNIEGFNDYRFFKIKEQFENKKEVPKKLYTGDILSKLPLDIITN